MKKITLVILALAVIFGLMLSACSPASSGDGGTTGEGLGGKKLVVAHDVNFPPFEFLKDDTYTGFDLDLMNEISKVANFEIEYRPMDFNGIIPALQANQVDMSIAAMTIKPEREEVIDFSTAYFRTGLVLAVTPDNNDIVNPEDLKWHIDEEDRIIEPIEKTDWLFQFDNQLPFPIDSKIEIKKGTWHRIIKGTGELVLKIVKY